MSGGGSNPNWGPINQGRGPNSPNSLTGPSYHIGSGTPTAGVATSTQPQGNMPTWVPQQIGGGSTPTAGANQGWNPNIIDPSARQTPGQLTPQGATMNPQGNMPTWVPQYPAGGLTPMGGTMNPYGAGSQVNLGQGAPWQNPGAYQNPMGSYGGLGNFNMPMGGK